MRMIALRVTIAAVILTLCSFAASAEGTKRPKKSRPVGESMGFHVPSEDEQKEALDDCLKQHGKSMDDMKEKYPAGREVSFESDFATIGDRLRRVVYEYETDQMQLDSAYQKLKKKITAFFEDEMKGDLGAATGSMKLQYEDLSKQLADNRMKNTGLTMTLKQVTRESDAYTRILKAGATNPVAAMERMKELRKKAVAAQKDLIPLQVQITDSWKEMPQYPMKEEDRPEFEAKLKKFNEAQEPIRMETNRLYEEIEALQIEERILSTAVSYEMYGGSGGSGFLQDPNTLIKMYEGQNQGGAWGAMGGGGYGAGMMPGMGGFGSGCNAYGLSVGMTGGLGGGMGGGMIGVPVKADKNKNFGDCAECQNAANQ